MTYSKCAVCGKVSQYTIDGVALCAYHKLRADRLYGKETTRVLLRKPWNLVSLFRDFLPRQKP